jgi:hypothetical protein
VAVLFVQANESRQKNDHRLAVVGITHRIRQRAGENSAQAVMNSAQDAADSNRTGTVRLPL